MNNKEDIIQECKKWYFKRCKRQPTQKHLDSIVDMCLESLEQEMKKFLYKV